MSKYYDNCEDRDISYGHAWINKSLTLYSPVIVVTKTILSKLIVKNTQEDKEMNQFCQCPVSNEQDGHRYE